MKPVSTLLFALGLFGLTGAVAAGTEQPDQRGEAALAKALQGRAAGQPVNCINQRDIQSSRVIKGTAIIYQVGGRLYVNRPSTGASSLDPGDILATRTVGTQLCSSDAVNLVDRSLRVPTGFVALGSF